MSGNIQHDDQNQVPDSLVEDAQQDTRFHEGKENSHQANDPKDKRSIANRLEHETKHDEDEDAGLSKEDKLSKIDATLPALAHGNKPSRGAIIDQQLREEEEEELRRKGKK